MSELSNRNLLRTNNLLFQTPADKGYFGIILLPNKHTFFYI